MSVLKYFKNIPRSPPHRATGLKCNFFFKFAMRSLEKKSPVVPPTGDRGLSPSPQATGRWAQPTGGRGPVGPPPGDRGIPPIKAPALPFPPHLSPKIPPKIQKKREE